MDRVTAVERDEFSIRRPIQFAASRNDIAGVDSLLCAAFRWHSEDLTAVFTPARKNDALSVGRPCRAAIMSTLGQLNLMVASDCADKNSGLFFARPFTRKRQVLSVRGKCRLRCVL